MIFFWPYNPVSGDGSQACSGLTEGQADKTIGGSASASPTPLQWEASMFELPAVNHRHRLHKAEERLGSNEEMRGFFFPLFFFYSSSN